MNNNNNTAITAQPKKEKYYLSVAVIISILSGLVSQILSYSYNYNYAYRDAIYRMEAARRFYDSLSPGIYKQLGTVWLPIPNLILMPLANIDYLWQTGLAASIINLPAFVISAVSLFLIVKLLTKNPAATWFSFLLFIFNFNILYFQTTAMTEQLYLTFMICSFYCLLVWLIENKNNYLFITSVLITLACGTRYDAWPIALLTILLVFIICIADKNKPFKHAILAGALPVLFIFSWFLYNWLRYGDALEFSRGQFSTLYQLKYYEERGRLLTKNNFWLSAKIYFSSVFLYSGVIYTIIGFLGLIFYSIKEKFSLRSLPLYLLWIALPTTLFLLYNGQLIIELPDSIPPGYFNSRYGLYLFPAIAISSGLAVSYLMHFKYRRFILISLGLIILYQQYLFFNDFPKNIPALAEAKASFSQPSENLSRYLKNNYKGGRILYDNVIFALHPWTGINLSERITYFTADIAEEVRNNPSKYVEWILFYTEATNDKIYDAEKNNPDFLNNFELKFSEYGVQAFKRK